MRHYRTVTDERATLYILLVLSSTISTKLDELTLIETLSILLIERENNQNNFATVPPTIYIGIELASQLPRQFLQELDTVILAIAEDSLLAQNILALLPNAEIANPQSSWNDIWIQLIEQKQLIEREQPTHKQNNQHQKQRIQEIELD